jgi:hypothetical protein
MGWVSVVISAFIALIKGFFGTDKIREDVVSETKQDADLDSALADPSRLPTPDKLRDTTD